MKSYRSFLFPFSLFYGLGVMARNLAFDLGILKSTEFHLPIISVGNLSVGGSGKSPMTEYLVRLLKSKYKIATLSRGYGRKSKGFRLVDESSLSTEVGDEPLQFKKKFFEWIHLGCVSTILKGYNESEKTTNKKKPTFG